MKKQKPTARECAESCLFSSVRRVSRVLERRYSRVLREVGLSASQFSVLVAVSLSTGPSITALARSLGMTQSTLSRQLTYMSERQWVETYTSEGGRALRVRISPPGEALLDEALPRWRRVQDSVVAELGRDVFPRLLVDLGRLAPAGTPE